MIQVGMAEVFESYVCLHITLLSSLERTVRAIKLGFFAAFVFLVVVQAGSELVSFTTPTYH